MQQHEDTVYPSRQGKMEQQKQQILRELNEEIEDSFEEIPQGKLVSDERFGQILRRRYGSLTFDFVLVLVPLFFILLAVASALLHKRPLSTFGQRLQDGLLLSPTIFPIAFACICGRMMRMLALYKSQSGLQLRWLEHLIGAQSLFSAVERLVSLRNYGLLGMTIVCLWAISPLGGQGLLRVLGQVPSFRTTQTPVKYLATDLFTSFPVFGGSGAIWTTMDISTLYLSSLCASTSVQQSPQDLWGNPKIPSLKSLVAPFAESGVWTEVKPVHERSYMNLIGIPIGNISGRSETELVINTVSTDFRCSPAVNTTYTDFVKNLTEAINPEVSSNGTISISPQSYMASGISTSFITSTNSSWTRFMANTSKPINIYYGVQLPTLTEIALMECSMSLVRIEAKVVCIDRSCEVRAMRQLPSDLHSGYVDNFYNLFTSGIFCRLGLSSYPFGISKTHAFLKNPSATIGSLFDTDIVLSNIPLEDLENRLTAAYNTFIYAANSLAFTQGLAFDTESYKFAAWANTTAKLIEPLGEIYRCNWLWFAIALAVCVVLEAVAIVNATLNTITYAPDLLGYVSSMAIDNEFCSQQDVFESSALDGLERARNLGDTKFMLADVKGNETKGYIAFVPVNGATQFSHSRVKLGRRYC